MSCSIAAAFRSSNRATEPDNLDTVRPLPVDLLVEELEEDEGETACDDDRHSDGESRVAALLDA